MAEGYQRRRRETVEFVCLLANSSGNYKTPLTAEKVLGSTEAEIADRRRRIAEGKARAKAWADELNDREKKRREGGE